MLMFSIRWLFGEPNMRPRTFGPTVRILRAWFCLSQRMRDTNHTTALCWFFYGTCLYQYTSLLASCMLCVLENVIGVAVLVPHPSEPCVPLDLQSSANG